MDAPQSAPSIRLWVLILGGVGFAAGFFGPMLLNPEANQGPMVGLFITGPGGALLGLALGVVFRVLPVAPLRKYQALGIVATLLALGTLYYCLPEPQLEGLLLDGAVRRCQPPRELAAAAISHWEQRIADAPWAEPRAGWQRDVPLMLDATEGVVLTLEAQRQNRILRDRRPWNRGRLRAEGWRSVPATTTDYFADFAGSACERYPAQPPTLYLRQRQGSGKWPPDDLANFLGTARIEPASPTYLMLGQAITLPNRDRRPRRGTPTPLDGTRAPAPEPWLAPRPG